MWYHYCKTAWRNLVKRQVFTLINMLGLSIGMAASLLILQYVRYERNYDKVSPHAPRIWRAFNESVVEGRVTTQDCNTHSALGPALKADLPEVVDFFRLYNGNQHEVVFFQDRQPIKVEHAWMTDPGFLRLFPQRFLEGDPSACLAEPWKMILSETAAKLLFPGQSAMGKTLHVPSGPFSGEYLVEGIVTDPPQNTHLKFSVLASYATRQAKGHRDNWSGYWDYTYFQLAPGAEVDKARRQLAAYSRQHLESEGIRLDMQPFERIHLHSDMTYEIEPNGSAQTVRFLGLVALFILAIAFINYINMTTARALERAKEVGLRKVVGAGRAQLLGQFMFEGLLLNGLALFIAFSIYQSALPEFGRLTGRPLEAQGFDHLFWASAGALFAAGALATCGYPALAMTRFAPLYALRGGVMGAGAEAWRRKALVVFQFGCSAALIFALVIVSRQLNFLRNHDNGLSLDQIVAVKLPVPDWRQDSLNRLRAGVLKEAFSRVGGVRALAASSVTPGLGINTISGTSGGVVSARRPSELIPGTIYDIDVEPDFFTTFGIRFLAGQAGVNSAEIPGLGHILINKALLDLLGFDTPEAAVGEEIGYPGSVANFRMKIVGVVANFHIETLKEPARPTIYRCMPNVRQGYLSLKIDAAATPSALAALELSWKNIFPESPFEYWFLDERFALQYTAEARLAKVFALFATMAIIIACLGLYGLAAYAATQRTREIGIRKVLGASVSGIVVLLSKDFLKPAALGIVVAAPLAWYVMNKWLRDFAHRIDIDWWMFPQAGMVAVAAAALTVSVQSLKAALANPAKSLRTAE
jgi:putative ABC transport system permease protein